LKQSIATIDVMTAIQRRDVAATSRTMSRKLRATVVAFAMCSHRTYAAVTAAMATAAPARRPRSG
jgi:hypothetical protein